MITKADYQNKARLGLINYINCLPIVLPILKRCVAVDAEVILGEPTTLNSLFAARELEYGAMSAFAFLEQSDHLELIPTVSISSERAVSSVLLFSRKPVETFWPAKVAVPMGSATSVNAMLLMLAQYNKQKSILYTVSKPDLEEDELDAALVIGDRALLVDEDWSKKYHRYDLGQWWHASFNLPMVFGVFAVRADWLLVQNDHISKKLVVEQLGKSLAHAAELGLGDYFGAVVKEAEFRTGLSRSRLEQYYRKDLNFDWTPRHLEAITKYGSMCRQMGILEDKKVLA